MKNNEIVRGFFDRVISRGLVVLIVLFIYGGVVGGVDNVFFFLIFFAFGLVFLYQLSGGDISSPGIWFSVVVGLYGFSLPFLSQMGFYEANFPDQVLWLVCLFLAGVFLVVAIFDGSAKVNFNVTDYNRASVILFKFGFFAQIAYVLFHLLFFSGTKTEAALLGINRFSVIQQWYLVFYCARLVCLMGAGLSGKRIFLLSFLVSVFSSLVTGERDLLVGVVVVTVITSSVFERRSFLVYATFAFSGIAIFTVLQWFRNIFGGGASGYSSDLPFYVEILMGEPLSASRNLDYLIGFVGNKFSGFERFFVDVLSAFVPKFFYYFENSENWFNKEFFGGVVEIGGGLGFGLIANAYLYGGMVSVVLFSYLLTFILVYLRKKAFDSFIVFVGFIGSISLFFHAVRSDFAVLIGAPLRSVVPACFCLYILSRIYKRNG